MGEVTGISWTDSTVNFWEGCTKVGPGCDHCYAATRNARFHPISKAEEPTVADGSGGLHWGPGAPRRRSSEHVRNDPGRWQRKAAEFMAKHGHPRRVFCSSLADIFDNEVPDEWRAEAFSTMEATPDLRWQLCTKRVSNIQKMVPAKWGPAINHGGHYEHIVNWPKNVGVLITVVTPEEMLRDVPRLTDLKARFGIPWIGLSIEPMIANVAGALRELAALGILQQVDWAIFGGESGPEARPCNISWISRGVDVCHGAGVHVFVKQMGADPRLDDGTRLQLSDPAGKAPAEWPVVNFAGGSDILRTRNFPAALCS